jgi:hypothetical protein
MRSCYCGERTEGDCKDSGCTVHPANAHLRQQPQAIAFAPDLNLHLVHVRAGWRVNAERKATSAPSHEQRIYARVLRLALDEIDRQVGLSTGEWCEDCGKPRALDEVLMAQRKKNLHHCLHCGGRTVTPPQGIGEIE